MKLFGYFRYFSVFFGYYNLFYAVFAVTSLFLFGKNVELGASSCGNEFTNDNIFLKTKEGILFTSDSCLGENSCGLLEGSCREEGFCCERCLGNTEKCGDIGCFFELGLPCLDTSTDSLVFCIYILFIHIYIGNEVCISAVNDLELSHHLTNDNFDMLIVDINTL